MRALLNLIATVGVILFLLGVLWLLHATTTRLWGLPAALIGGLLFFLCLRGLRRLG
ncbi:hypothetical protein ACFFWC_11545 [Plantactinospora siamensis]|uniref:DUF4175 domain-containing protein n=1 Tax=Plantactinospora siamensis TaxID=555372 RepID=A0ABV6NZX2_9ACTN